MIWLLLRYAARLLLFTVATVLSLLFGLIFDFEALKEFPQEFVAAFREIVIEGIF